MQKKGNQLGRLADLILLGTLSVLLAFAPGCTDQYALLITMRVSAPVSSFDLFVKSLPEGNVLLVKRGEQVDPTNPLGYMSQPTQSFKLAIEFSQPGNYLLYILGRNGQQHTSFFIRDYQVDGVREVEIFLVPLTVDQDQDGFPPCGTEGINCATIACNFLDCEDNKFDVNPVAQEICGNGLDDDCSGGCNGDIRDGDVPCKDLDGDGSSPPLDCDDNDPCRSGSYVEAGNTCDYTGKGCSGGIPADQFPALAPACLEKMGQGAQPPYCGDGIDQDCNGQDEPCFEDQDCDCSGKDEDCDDTNPDIPRMAEVCYDGLDNNCNDLVDEGCLPCDIDGDGHARFGSGSNDPNCQFEDDPDDYDAGIYPGVTADDISQREGGHLLGALREFCSYGPTKNDTPGKPERHRDVDHDRDMLPASQDGCPSEECDHDGDGFEGAQCTPPQSKLDCDDNNAKIFPGAPDYAGDNIAQNCVSDVICIADTDNDHYCDDVDCDDSDPNIHPWATEICDNKDNDCDGLVDEGNPDHLGQAISTLEPNCNDDNDGQCAQPKVSGQCACSPSKPNATLDPQGNRFGCTEEDWQANASLRCFGAKQPEKERCESGDFDCDGQDINETVTEFAEYNSPCSFTKGSCTAGVVTGCNLKLMVPFWEKVQAILPGYNPHWICSGRLPIDELCNGKDDACDGDIPADELDLDYDGFIACFGCDPSSTDPRVMLDPLLGCGDCNPNSGEVHQCPSGCCNGQCRDLSRDTYNCGGCGHACDPGLDCVDGQCQCLPGGACDGCCVDQSTCVLSSALIVNQCGINGGECKNCRDANACTQDRCDLATGTCTNNPFASETSCNNNTGICLLGSCCTGCIEGDVCYIEDLAHCGDNGGACNPCVAANSCQQTSCALGICQMTNLNGACVINGVAGQCAQGSCCTGCIDAGVCYVNNPAHCGEGGGTCTTCPVTGDCQQASCVAGACAVANLSGSCKKDQIGGTCVAGECCTGCTNNQKTLCLSGEDHEACGDWGEVCEKCKMQESCWWGDCWF